TTCITAEEHIPADNIIIRTIRNISRMFLRRQREQIVLNQHRVRIRRVQAPFSVVVREVAEYDDMMSLFPTAPKITVEHDPGPGSNELLPGAGVTCDVKSFDNDVVGSLEQDHPIRIAFRRTINLDLTGLAHGL